MVKISFIYPWVINMRLATTSMMLSLFLTAIDLKGLLQCGRAR